MSERSKRLKGYSGRVKPQESHKTELSTQASLGSGGTSPGRGPSPTGFGSSTPRDVVPDPPAPPYGGGSPTAMPTEAPELLHAGVNGRRGMQQLRPTPIGPVHSSRDVRDAGRINRTEATCSPVCS